MQKDILRSTLSAGFYFDAGCRTEMEKITMAVQKNDSSGNIRLTSSGSDTGVTHAEDTIRSK
jgi:hypothetical protein